VGLLKFDNLKVAGERLNQAKYLLDNHR